MSHAFHIPLKTVSLANQREHWRTRHKRSKRERQLAKWLTPRNVQLPCVVKLTRGSPGTLDDDNLRGAFKSIRDGIADKLGIDDRDSRVTWEYAQEKCKAYMVSVEISEPAAGRSPDNDQE